jgi:hypothetical protein
MRLEELLVAKGIVRPADIERAAERGRSRGGPITDHLLALDLITPEQVDAALQMSPPSLPATAEETGINTSTLDALLLKGMHYAGVDTVPELVDLLRLPSAVVSSLLQQAVEQGHIKVTGSDSRAALPVLSYSLTPSGRMAALAAWERNRYVGPAPVSLQAFSERILRQRLHFDGAEAEKIKNALSDLIIEEQFVDQIGPAINAGRSILFYGPPGNGKSSIAKRIGRVFSDVIFVPYSIEVEGQIIQIYDPNVHEPVSRGDFAMQSDIKLRHENFDRRWVACRRPVVVTGGEFTLEMLDLRYLETSNFYEAPLHVKAMGGTFVIDDFGRQLVRPKDLLNRWMIPLEERHDYLRLHTGATFSLPFDELVVFCTNLAPDDLMDAAFLRRIPYKVRLGPPTVEQFRNIFQSVAAQRGLEFSEPVFQWLLDELQNHRHLPLGRYQPGFIVDHVAEISAFRKKPPEITQALIVAALDNLYTTNM